MKRLVEALCGGALGTAILLGTASSSPAFYWYGWPKGQNPPPSLPPPNNQPPGNPPEGPPTPPSEPPPIIDHPPHAVPEPAAGIAALIGLTALTGWRLSKRGTA